MSCLRTWKERNDNRMGLESIGGREVPLVIVSPPHAPGATVMSGRLTTTLEGYALRRTELFVHDQSLIELSGQGGERVWKS